MSRYWHGTDRARCPLSSRYRGDSVAKLFWAPERATLIQEQRLRRNIDSTNPSPRFDYCASAASCRVLQQNRGVSGLIADILRPPSLTQHRHKRGAIEP